MISIITKNLFEYLSKTFNAFAIIKQTLSSVVHLHFLALIPEKTVAKFWESLRRLGSICVCFCLTQTGVNSNTKDYPCFYKTIVHNCYVVHPCYKRVQRLLHICYTQGTGPWEY